ncbi:hypothetical protein IMZ48_01785 [Candidatus Bathyarchaeota archaeon]|nr:hypothetical protein [Candidatus Bathyarchaeota archaeon]
MSDSEDPIDLQEEGDDLDLFGDDDEGQSGSPPPQVLSDNDADSDGHASAAHGYDSDRDQDALDHQDKVIAGIQIYRHRMPKTKDGLVSHYRPIGYLLVGMFAPGRS